LRLARDHPAGADESLAAREHTPVALDLETALRRPLRAKEP
jgi:hypothetical protein